MAACSLILDCDKFSLGALADLAPQFKETPSIWGAKLGDSVEEHGAKQISGAINGTLWMHDCKKYDTRDRLARSVARLAALYNPPTFLTIASEVGHAAMKQAVCARKSINLIGVTVLSSWDDDFCKREYNRSRSALAIHRAEVALQAGIQGITYPADLLPSLMAILGKDSERLLIIATGVVSDGVPAHNHTHPRTPEFAFQYGATHAVIGREVTDTPDPIATLRTIAERCGEASAR